MGHWLGIGAVIIMVVSLLDLLRWIYRELTRKPDPQQELPFGQHEDEAPELPAPKPAKPKPKQVKLTYTQWIEQRRDNIRELPREPGEDRFLDQEVKISQAEIMRQARSLAVHLAEQANMELSMVQTFYREIMDRGGIRRYANDKEKEEYEVNVPVWYRRKTGLPPDEMAAELGFDTDSDLYDAIAAAERGRQAITAKLPRIPGKNGWKKVKRWRAKDFLDEAKWQLEEEYMIGIVEEVSLDEIPF